MISVPRVTRGPPRGGPRFTRGYIPASLRDEEIRPSLLPVAQGASYRENRDRPSRCVAEGNRTRRACRSFPEGGGPARRAVLQNIPNNVFHKATPLAPVYFLAEAGALAGAASAFSAFQ